MFGLHISEWCYRLKKLFVDQPVEAVFEGTAVSAKGLGSISGPVKLEAGLPTAYHLCAAFSKLCCPDA